MFYYRCRCTGSKYLRKKDTILCSCFGISVPQPFIFLEKDNIRKKTKAKNKAFD